MSDRPEIEIQRQTAFGEDGELEVTETSVETSLEDFGADVDPAEVPEEIESITCELACEQPPTNPLVVLKAARWWYIHGKGSTDPAFQWAIEWAHHLACDTPSDVDQFDTFLEYLVSVGFVDETEALR